MEDNRFQDHTENICFFYEMLKKLDGIPSAFVSNADESGSQDWVNKIGGITYVPKGYENEVSNEKNWSKIHFNGLCKLGWNNTTTILHCEQGNCRL